MEKLDKRNIHGIDMTSYKRLAWPENGLQEPDIRRMDRSSMRPDYSYIFLETTEKLDYREIFVDTIRKPEYCVWMVFVMDMKFMQQLYIKKRYRSGLKKPPTYQGRTWSPLTWPPSRS